MRLGMLLGVAAAVALHFAVLMLGGYVLPGGHEGDGTVQEVALLTEEDAPEKDAKKDEEKEEPKEPEEIEAPAEDAPPTGEPAPDVEISAAQSAPALEAASLGAIEAALNGQGAGGGDFGDSVSFSSGGRIGGTGKSGAGGGFDQEFNLSEIDQKPRPTYQVAPAYPAGLKSVEGVVSIIFIVDPAGRVTRARVEKSSRPEFEKPALDALKQWKFEPAMKGGQRVACKMRVPIRFQPK